MQYRKKGTQAASSEQPNKPRQDDRGGRKSNRRGGQGPGQQYRPKNESTMQAQYQPKGQQSSAYASESASKPQEHGGKHGRPRRTSERLPEQYQPKQYRVKGGEQEQQREAPGRRTESHEREQSSDDGQQFGGQAERRPGRRSEMVHSNQQMSVGPNYSDPRNQYPSERDEMPHNEGMYENQQHRLSGDEYLRHEGQFQPKYQQHHPPGGGRYSNLQDDDREFGYQSRGSHLDQHWQRGRHSEVSTGQQYNQFASGEAFATPGGPHHGPASNQDFNSRYDRREMDRAQMHEQHYQHESVFAPQNQQHPDMFERPGEHYPGYGGGPYHPGNQGQQAPYGHQAHGDQQHWQYQGGYGRPDSYQGGVHAEQSMYGRQTNIHQRGFDDRYHPAHGERSSLTGSQMPPNYHQMRANDEQMNEARGFPGHFDPGHDEDDQYPQQQMNSAGFSAEARPFQPRKDSKSNQEDRNQDHSNLQSQPPNEHRADREGESHEHGPHQKQSSTPDHGHEEEQSNEQAPSHQGAPAQQPALRYRPKTQQQQNDPAPPSSHPNQKSKRQNPEPRTKYQPKEYRPKEKDRGADQQVAAREFDEEPEVAHHRRGHPETQRGKRGRGDHRHQDDRRQRQGLVWERRSDVNEHDAGGQYAGRHGVDDGGYYGDRGGGRRTREQYREEMEYWEEYDRQRRSYYGRRDDVRDRRGGRGDEDYDYDYGRDYAYMDWRGGADYDRYDDDFDPYDYDYGHEYDRYEDYGRESGPPNQRGGRGDGPDRRSYAADKRRRNERSDRRADDRGEPDRYRYGEEPDRPMKHQQRSRHQERKDRQGNNQKRRGGRGEQRSASYDRRRDDRYQDFDDYYDEEDDYRDGRRGKGRRRYPDSEDDDYHDYDQEEEDEEQYGRRPSDARRHEGEPSSRGKRSVRDKRGGRQLDDNRKQQSRQDKRRSDRREEEEQFEGQKGGGRRGDRGGDRGQERAAERGGRRGGRGREKRAARGRGGPGTRNDQRDDNESPMETVYREKAGNSQEMTQGDKKDAPARRQSHDRSNANEQRGQYKRKEYRKKPANYSNDSDQSAEEKVDDRDSLGEIDKERVDDFADDEFKWDDKEFEEDEPDFLAADSSSQAGTSEDHGTKSSAASTSTSSSAPGGNNQVSRKYYQMGPATDTVKTPCTVMMVAEKPSIALSITEALCGKNFAKRSGPAKGIPIYTFKGHFKGHSANFKVTSVAGHVYNRDFPREYQNRSKDPAILFDAPTVKKCDPRSRPVAKQLQMVAKNLDFMVLWLDCDKEGENICFEVLDICKQYIPRSSGRVQRVFRAKFSSIAKKDIVNAFEGLKSEPNFNEAISVDARQVLDLKIGVAFSRFQTNRLASAIRKAGIRMLTYGPCQTPTLGFCVDQAEKIKKFVPETYWRVEAEMVDENGRRHTMKWCRGKVFDKTAVQVIHDRLQRHYGGREAEVLSVRRNTVKQVRPQGLNTVKLLKVGSQSFGMSAHETMKIAEHLYLNGYTTYPRTESTTFSSNFNFKEVLTALKEHEDYGTYAQNLLKKGFNKPRKGVDAGDHPPITPVKAARAGQLRDRDLKIYEYITANFLACISEDATYEALRCELLIGEEKFKLKGQLLKDEGFLEVMPWQRHSDKEVPQYEIGDIIDIVSTSVTEKKTEPPSYLTEAELIEKMEKHAIGTDASIPTHISNIIGRNYVTVLDPGRKLVPTPLGHALVKGYCEIDPELVLPQVRSNIEKSCELIARGKADFQKVMGHVLHIFKNKFNFFRLSVGTMERILTIMLNVGDDMNSNCISAKIPLKDESKDTYINFCIKCFKGHVCLQYHQKKGWGLKCDTCNSAVRVCQGAARIRRLTGSEAKCQECGSIKVDVYYKDSSPFPEGQSHVGCFLCDNLLSSLVKNPLKTLQPKLMTTAEAEEAQRLKEERKKLKEEKKAQRDKEAEGAQGAAGQGTAGQTAGGQAGPTKKKNKNKTNKGAKAVGDLLTAEERMNEFMQKYH